MYSNERGSRFSILDLVVKIIFFVLFVLVLLWLFPKVPNMTPFYSNVFRDNISYMQEAGEAYFTDDKMPKEIGTEVKITLAELFEKKLVLPFVDKDGNSCNQYDSYVSIIKNLDESYSLKTNLVCGEESDYLVKILGCHTYCKDNQCTKACHKEQIVQYQFKKAVKKTVTTYSCPSGYARNGKKCYKTVLEDTKPAEVTTVSYITLTMPSKLIVTPGTTLELGVIKKEKPDITRTIYDKVIVNTTPGSSSTETTCTTSYRTESYSCDCTTHTVDFKKVVTCNTCTRSIPVETCSDHTVTTPGKTTYTCPAISTGSSGEGANKKCWHTVTEDGGYTYSCPLEATNYTGANETLRCFKKTAGSSHRVCTDSTYTLEGEICKKVIREETTILKCDSGYVLENKVCNKYKKVEKNATSSTSTKTTYKYTWSEKSSLSGWIKTGKTKTVEGKEICE